MGPLRRSGQRPLRLLSGHLGSSVSALVDGQLDEEAAERAWQHVAQCLPCRRLVEHEGWVKRRLAQIADAPRADAPSDRLLGSLMDLDPTAVAWAETQELEDRSRNRRRAGIALVGVGSVSAAVLGFSTLGAAPLDFWGGHSTTPTSSIGGARSTPAPPVVAPQAVVHGRLRGWTLEPGANGTGRAHAVADHR